MGQGLPSEALRTLYDFAAKTYPDSFKNYEFMNYLGFLVNFGLILEKDGRYFITPLGREFLSYLTATGKPPFKDF
jgi:hypothetical protein